MRSKKFLRAEQAPLIWDAPGLIAGVDEAGRGPLAGPVVAAAVILDDLNPIVGLADSKKLTALKRERLYDEIRAKALCCSIAEATVEEIDELNILQATMLAMRRAVEGLRLKPTKVLVDGNRLPVLDVLAEAIVKGDSKVQAIACLSLMCWPKPSSKATVKYKPFQRPPSWPKFIVTVGAKSCMRSTLNMVLMPTKVMARQRICKRSKSTVPHRGIANLFRPWQRS